MFLDSQLHRKQKYSDFTSEVIEDTLIKYIDRHIQSKNNGTKFEVMSASSGINYYCLVRYISPLSNFHSRKLALRVGRILELGDIALLKHAVKYYVHYVSDAQKGKVIAWAKKVLIESFDFQLFSMLIGFNTSISEGIINNLRIFLRERVSYKEKASTGPIQVYPITDYYEELNQAGYWCLLGNIKKDSLAEFIGKSDMFDFFYQYNYFDFSKFDVSWLLNKQLNAVDEKMLSKVLAEYFC